MDERPITTTGFDMEQGEIVRVSSAYAINRLIPLGFFAGFTRFRQLAVLMLIHGLGRMLFARLMPHEARLTRLYARLKKKKQQA
ncbi:MAG: hypothetical protein GX087_00940 [Desulfobulbaceae bacterium]|nr:hypothetical protein [Desulfobulbaceae bacterium]